MKTTEFQALDALGAFKAMCESHGASCHGERASPIELPGVDFCLSWDVASRQPQGEIELGMAVVGLSAGKVVSASFEPSGRVASAEFLGHGDVAGERAGALAQAFELWRRDEALAQGESRRRLSEKLQASREAKRGAVAPKAGPR